MTHYRQRFLLIANLVIIGQLFFLASASLLPIISAYSLTEDSISELALGKFGFVQTIAFLVSGLGILAFAWTVRKLTKGSRGSFMGSLLLGIYGSGAILAAIFPTDPINSASDIWSQSTSGTIHVAAASVGFLAIVAGLLTLAWTFRKKAQWRPLYPWIVLCSGGALALFFGQNPGPLAGLMQRLFILVVSIWFLLVAFRVRSIAKNAYL